ncbi:MAG: DUF2950 family protein [Acidobacteriaceae bacterium]|nr:DUF2950 family protein [Acidobacteriaceae bacterium]
MGGWTALSKRWLPPVVGIWLWGGEWQCHRDIAIRPPLAGLFISSVIVFTPLSCSNQEKPAETQPPPIAETFATADDASKALVEAAKSDNREAMLTIFGAGAKDLIYSVVRNRMRSRLRDLYLTTKRCTAGASWTTEVSCF